MAARDVSGPAGPDETPSGPEPDHVSPHAAADVCPPGQAALCDATGRLVPPGVGRAGREPGAPGRHTARPGGPDDVPGDEPLRLRGGRLLEVSRRAWPVLCLRPPADRARVPQPHTEQRG